MRIAKFLKAQTHDDILDLFELYKTNFIYNSVGSCDEQFTIICPNDMRDDEVMPCFVAHTDIVGIKVPKTLNYCDGVLSNPDGILGADDRAGCYILGEMINADIRGIYIITSGEEIGGIGASACSKSYEFADIIPNISCFIELDRESNNDCAIYGLDNENLIGLFEDIGYNAEYGSYTDVVTLAEYTNIACINLSVGYYNQHSKMETLVMSEMKWTLDNMLERLPKEIYDTVFEATDDISLSCNKSGYDGFEPICCEWCNDHSLLYDFDGFQICEECLVEGMFYEKF